MLTVKLEKGDCLSPETVSWIEQIAREDHTDFATAMRGYDLLVDLVDDLTENHRRALERNGKSSEYGDTFNKDEIVKRILESRKTLHLTLARAVRLFLTESSDDGVKKTGNRFRRLEETMEFSDGTKKKLCRHDRCVKPVDDSSYYWCKRHLPVNPESDDGGVVYPAAPPHGLSHMVHQRKVGDRKVKGGKGGHYITAAPLPVVPEATSDAQ
jgi:hypothetical protein